MISLVRAFGPTPEELAGVLLVAHPSLQDPNFRRSVVLMASHDEKEGALGFVINRPVERTVSELLPGEPALGKLGGVPVLMGGPVGTDRLMFASFRWTDERYVCRPHLPAEEARELMEDPLLTVRAFAGYAGWAGGQLEAELVQRSWVVYPPDADTLELAHGELWRGIIRKLGPLFRLLADAPDDPSLN